MDARLKTEWEFAFVLNDQAVKKLWARLSRFGPVTAQALCADDIVRTFDSEESLLEFENARSRAIRLLRFLVLDGEKDFVDLVLSWPIELEIEGPELEIIHLRDDLRALIDGARAWYSRVATLSAVQLGFPAGLAGVALAFIAANLLKLPILPPAPFENLLAILVLSMTLVLPGGPVLLKVVRRVFPVRTFAIGQGNARHRHLETVRWTVVVGFLVSIAASAVLAIF